MMRTEAMPKPKLDLRRLSTSKEQRRSLIFRHVSGCTWAAWVPRKGKQFTIHCWCLRTILGFLDVVTGNSRVKCAKKNGYLHRSIYQSFSLPSLLACFALLCLALPCLLSLYLSSFLSFYLSIFLSFYRSIYLIYLI